MTKFLIASLFFTVFSGCQYLTKHEAKSAPESPQIEQLRAMYEDIYSEAENELDPVTGMPGEKDCDLALWAGLACYIGMPVKIELLEYSPGEIHRRPHEACWNETQGDVGSKSTISRDMLVGYSMCLWARKDLPALQRMADYGERFDWIMGKPAHLVGRVLLSGNGIGVLARAIYILSNGQDDRYLRRTGYIFPVVTEDFERHIQTQSILLQDSVDAAYNLTTAINQEMLERLTENAAAFPADYLFQAALGRFTGDQSVTINLLLSFDADEPVCSSYVRGERPDLYCKLNWIQAAQIVLGE